MGGLNPPMFSGGAAVIGQPPFTQVGTDDLPLKCVISHWDNVLRR